MTGTNKLVEFPTLVPTKPCLDTPMMVNGEPLSVIFLSNTRGSLANRFFQKS